MARRAARRSQWSFNRATMLCSARGADFAADADDKARFWRASLPASRHRLVCARAGRLLQMRRTDLAPRFTRNTAILPRRTGAVADSLNHFRFTSSRHKRVPLHPTRRSAGRMHLRHCERSEAIHFLAQAALDCFVASLLAMTTRKILLATHPRPSFANHNDAICKKNSPLATKEGDEAPRGALSYQSPRLRPPASSKRFITLQGAIHLWVPARSGQAYWRARTEGFQFHRRADEARRRFAFW